MMKTKILFIFLTILIGTMSTYTRADEYEFRSSPSLEYPNLPSKILCGYGGYFLAGYPADINGVIRDTLDPMYKSGFTACDFKILPQNFDLNEPGQMQKLRRLADEIRKRDMVFLTHVVGNPHGGRRDPEKHSKYPPFVNAKGETDENKFSLIYWPTFDMVFKNAYVLASLSDELNITAVSFDLEVLLNTAISYDDYAWSAFAVCHNLSEDTEKNERHSLLLAKGMVDSYEDWFKQQLELVAQKYEAKMHQIAPNLMLGMMPSPDNWFYNAFVKHLATKDTPAIIDSWLMYRGDGFNQAVVSEQVRIKSLNANNLYIPWLRVNSYYPDDLTIQCYYAAMGTDGYSNWTIHMLLEDNKLPSDYALPAGYSAGDYWQAYSKANSLIKKDLSDNSDQRLIEYKPVKPLVPAIDFNGFEFQEFYPAGSGEGQPQWMVLRNQQVIYVYADAGENIHIEIKHMATSRPLAINWAVLDKDKNILQDETVTPGGSKVIKIAAPYSGTFALVLTGGDGGQAWYGVKVHNKHTGLLAKYNKLSGPFPKTYLFFTSKTDKMQYWVSRTDINETAQLQFFTSRHEIFEVQFDNENKVVGSDTKRLTLDLPPRKVIKMVITKPKDMLEGFHLQNIFINVKGAVEPLLFDGQERRLSSKCP